MGFVALQSPSRSLFYGAATSRCCGVRSFSCFKYHIVNMTFYATSSIVFYIQKLAILYRKTQMICYAHAESEAQGTRSDQEECRGSFNRGCDSRVGRAGSTVQGQPLPFTGDDRKKTNTFDAARSSCIGKIIEQLISDSVAQAQEHEKTAEMLRTHAKELSELLKSLNNKDE